MQGQSGQIEEQEKWLINSLSRPEALTSDIEKAIALVRSNIYLYKPDTKSERDNLSIILQLLTGKGDWGIPIEELKALYPNTEDSDLRVSELMDVLNIEFSKLEGKRFSVLMFNDYHHISVEKKVAQVVCLDDIEKPRVVNLWWEENI